MFSLNKPDTVDGVMGAFRSTVNKLLAVADKQARIAADKQEAAAILLTESNESFVESQRATGVAAKLSNLFESAAPNVAAV